jgi:hypothetical protein
MIEIIHQEEAWEHLRRIEDPITKTLTSFALATCLKEIARGTEPDCDFDLLYFTKLIEKIVSQRETLQYALSGHSLNWEGEDKDASHVGE